MRKSDSPRFACLVPLLATALLALSACQPPGPGGGSSRGAGEPATPQVPMSDGTPTLGGSGTFDMGGGGNGYNGQTMESYAKTYARNIETLPEYKRYIQPILRRMNQGTPDVFVAYLNWAAREKAWYFVPHELPKLPKEQVGITFESEQHARHYDQEIYIHGPTYDNKDSHDKAMLLMHEMVMAAKFLMKKSPQAQCEALSKARNIASCQNPEYLKLAIPYTPVEEKDLYTANGVDHERIRMMTVYLMDESQDVSASSILAMRSRLGFVFPWDPLLSTVKPADLLKALKRAHLSEDVFVASENYVSKEKRTCVVGVMTLPTYFNLGLLLIDYSPPDAVPTNGIVQARHSVRIDEQGPSSSYVKQISMSSLSTESLQSHFEAKGVPHPTEPGKIADLVRILPNDAKTAAHGAEMVQVDFYISRDDAPRVIQIRATVVKALRTNTPSDDGKTIYKGEIEFVPVSSKSPVSCVLD